MRHLIFPRPSTCQISATAALCSSVLRWNILLIPVRILLYYWNVMGDSLDGSENTPEAQNVVVVDFQDFANYLRRAATVLLPEDDIVPPALNAALDDKVNQDCIRKFITDPQVSSLYVQRFSSKGEIITTDRYAIWIIIPTSVITRYTRYSV